jgi:hypothetical protein
MDTDVLRDHPRAAVHGLDRLERELHFLEHASGSKPCHWDLFLAQQHLHPLHTALRRLVRRPTKPTMSQQAQT